MVSGNLSKDDLGLDSESDLEGYEEWHGIDDDAEVDLDESDDDDVDEDDEETDDESEEGEDDDDDNEVTGEEVEEDVKGRSASEDADDAIDSNREDHATGLAETSAAEKSTLSPAAPAGRYIPPHLRAAQLGEKAAADGAKVAERIKLERKAQGLLNK